MINSESSELKQIVRGNIPPNAYFFRKRACSNIQWCLPSPNKVLDKDLCNDSFKKKRCWKSNRTVLGDYITFFISL